MLKLSTIFNNIELSQIPRTDEHMLYRPRNVWFSSFKLNNSDQSERKFNEQLFNTERHHCRHGHAGHHHQARGTEAHTTAGGLVSVGACRCIAWNHGKSKEIQETLIQPTKNQREPNKIMKTYSRNFFVAVFYLLISAAGVATEGRSIGKKTYKGWIGNATVLMSFS